MLEIEITLRKFFSAVTSLRRLSESGTENQIKLVRQQGIRAFEIAQEIGAEVTPGSSEYSAALHITQHRLLSMK